MTTIVNLSSLHSLRSIKTGVDAFVELCDRYSKTGCFSCCPSLFTKLSNTAWVMYFYQQNLSTLINPYKLGQINTHQFLEKILRIFNFLDDDTIIFDKNDRDRIVSNKNNFLSTKGISTLSDRNIALALLEEAWNAIIEFSDADAVKFDYVLSESKKEPIYLISNTNELNVHKILCLLKQKFPQITFNDVDLSVNSEGNNEFLEVAPNIFLCLSYKTHLFKTTSENKESQATTPSLLRHLVNKLQSDKSNIKVVSQYGKDLEEASRLDIPQSNLFSAESYYPKPVKELRYTM